MSTTVDERVVSMQFDNSDFEKNVKTSMSTLDKFKRKLKFDDSADSFNNLERSANKVRFNGIVDNLEDVGKKIDAWTVARWTAISHMTEKVIQAAEQMIKSLSLDQVSAGWEKYAEKTEAVQTLMGAIKKDAEGIEFGFTEKEQDRKMRLIDEYVAKLNWFADETSYNFTTMTSTVGKFVSNGVDLETATAAIQGIATWAAVSGQNAQTASVAMTQLAQALGSGTVRLQDWMSVENANMATSEFKQIVMDTAVAQGKLIKEGDKYYTVLGDEEDALNGAGKGLKQYHNGVEGVIESQKELQKGTEVTVETFRNTLADKWFTKDVLVEATEQYGAFSNRLATINSELDNSVVAVTWNRMVDAWAETKTIDNAQDRVDAQEKLLESYTKVIGKDANTTRMYLEDLTGGYADYAVELEKIDKLSDKEITEEERQNRKRELAIKFMEATGDAFEDVDKAQEYMEGLSKATMELGRRAFKAAQETKTFREAMDATKDAASTVWMNIFEKIFGNYLEAKALWSDLAERLNTAFVGPLYILQDVFKEWKKLGGADDLFGLDEVEGMQSAYTALLDTFDSLFGIRDDPDKGPSALMKGFVSFWASAHEGFELVEDDTENFYNVISELIGKLKSFTVRIREWANSLIPDEDKMKGFQGIFQSLFSAVHIVKTLVSYVGKLMKPLKNLAGGILSRLIKGAGEGESLIVKLDKFLNGDNKILKVINAISNGIQGIVDLILKAIDGISSGKGFGEIFDTDFFSGLFSRMLTGLVKAFSSAKEFLWPKIQSLFESMLSGLSNMSFRGFKGAIGSDEMMGYEKREAVFDAIKNVLVGVLTVAKVLVGIIPAVFATIFKWIQKIDFATLASNVKAIIDAISAGFSKIFSGENKIDFMSFVLSFIDLFFSGLEAGVKLLNVVLPLLTKLFTKISATIDKFSSASAVANIEKVLGVIKTGFQGFVKALTGRDTSEGMAILTDFLNGVFEGLKFIGNLIRLIGSLIKSALSKANEGMQGFSWDKFGEWFTNFKENVLPGIKKKLSDIRAELILFAPVVAAIMTHLLWLKTLKIGKSFVKGIKELAESFDDMFGLKKSASAKKIRSIALLIAAISGAIALLAYSIIKLTEIEDTGKMWQAAGVIGAIIGALTAFMVLTLVFAKVATKGLKEKGQIKEFAKVLQSLGFVMAVLGGVIFLIAYTMERLSQIDNVWEMYGVVAAIWGLIALFLVEAAIISKKAGDISGVIPILIALVACIAAMAFMVKKLADLNNEGLLLPGMLGLAGIVIMLMLLTTVVAVIAGLSKDTSGMLKVAGSILMFAGAMLAIAYVLKMISEMTINVENLLIFAAALGVMLIAMVALSSIGPEMLVVAAAMLTFATAAAMTALAMFLAAEAIALLSTHIGDIVPVIHELVVAGLDAAKTFIEWIIENIPLINDLLVNLAYMGIDILFKATMMLLERLANDAPAIAGKVIEIIISILDVLIENAVVLTAKATELGMCVVIGMLQGLAAHMAELLDAAVMLVVNFINGLGNALYDHADEIHDAVQNFLTGLLRLILTFFGIKGEAGDKISKGMGDLITNLGAYLLKLAATAIKFLGTFFSNLWTKIKSAFSSAHNKIKTEVQNVWNKVKETLTGWKDKFKEIAKDILQGLINGFLDLKQKVVDTVTGIGDKIQGGFKALFGIASPSKVFREYGHYMDEGLMLGLSDYAGKVESSAEEMGEGVLNPVSDAILRAYDLIENGVDMDPTIRPVLDLTNIQNGIGAMNGMLSGDYSVDASANYARQVADSEYASSASTSSSGVATSTTNNTDQSISNVFNISGDDPREIAEEVSRIIQQQIGRRNTVWA